VSWQLGYAKSSFAFPVERDGTHVIRRASDECADGFSQSAGCRQIKIAMAAVGHRPERVAAVTLAPISRAPSCKHELERSLRQKFAVDGLSRLVRRLAVTQYNDSIYVKSFGLCRLVRRLAVTLCQIKRYGKDWDVPITQAPNRKSLFYKVLWHYFGLPIIQAPKRNSINNKEMRPNSSFLMSIRARGGACSLTPSSFSLLESRPRAGRSLNRAIQGFVRQHRVLWAIGRLFHGANLSINQSPSARRL
jgi:hypothetical protein